MFMLLTFVTGFFGMNFSQLPFGGRAWFAVMPTAVLGSVITLLLFFRTSRWW